MTPDDLIALAAKATPGPWRSEVGNFIVSPAHHVVAEVDCCKGSDQDFAYLVACSPERIAALCRVAIAARDGTSVPFALAGLDAAFLGSK